MGAVAPGQRLSLSGQDLYGLILERIDGRPMRLARYWGQVLLVVNVVSQGPQASQLQELETLHRCFGDAGLRVMGFPCSDFGTSEPAGDTPLQQRYERELSLGFALFTRTHVAAESCHPLFTMLTRTQPLAQGPVSSCGVTADFEKFLVSRDGVLLARFGSQVRPLAPELLAALQGALGTPRNDQCSQRTEPESPACHRATPAGLPRLHLAPN